MDVITDNDWELRLSTRSLELSKREKHSKEMVSCEASFEF